MKSRALRVLCPQEYEGTLMRVVPCTRCETGWDASEDRCTVYVGVEHLPAVTAPEVPECLMADRCQHGRQSAPAPCAVRSRGLVCESALAWGGEPDAEAHPLAFDVVMME